MNTKDRSETLLIVFAGSLAIVFLSLSLAKRLGFRKDCVKTVKLNKVGLLLMAIFRDDVRKLEAP